MRVKFICQVKIQPTGKAFKMPVATVVIWKDGVMIEEHLFWDNQNYAYQTGLQKEEREENIWLLFL